MKYFVSTGEVSGDLHLSYLVENIKKKNSDVEFYGVAGEHSKKKGVQVIQDIDELAIMGFIEALTKYNFLKKKAKSYIKFIKNNNIKKVLLIDYGGFNLYFLKLLRKEIPGIKVFYYIPPKLWVWGERRIKKLKLADEILVIFPWEVSFYEERNIKVTYFGNPLVDKLKPINSEKKKNKILLLPGSRKKEVQNLLPDMLEVANIKKEEEFILKLASKEHISWIDLEPKDLSNVEIETEKDLQEISSEVKSAIAASGTVTLELALLEIPTVVGYKVNKINEWIARFIINLKFYSLPNITLDEEIFPELLQDKFNSRKIIKELENINSNYFNIKTRLKDIREILGGQDIIKKYSNFLLEN